MLTLYHLAIDNFNNSGKTLLRSTLSGVTLLVAPRLYDHLKNGGRLLDDLDPAIIGLLNEHFLVPSREWDIKRVLSKIHKKIEQEDVVSITLMTTGACNMACKYCFQNDLLSEKLHFSKDLVAPLIEWVSNSVISNRTRSLMFHFYGGEPLLNLPLIEEVVRKLRPRLSRRRITWNMSITTNGSLMTKAVADKLAQLGCSLAIISLDGPKETHNYRRPLKNQKVSSFDSVVNGIKNGLRHFDIMVRTNIDRQNSDYVVDLMDQMDIEGIVNHPRFYHSLEVVGPIRYPTQHTKTTLLSIKQSGLVIKELLGIQLDKGIKVFGNMPSETSCEHIMKSTFTVDHKGQVFLCPGFIGFPDFCLGNVKDGITYEFMNRLCHIRPWENETCITCLYLPQCHGGCRSCAVINNENYSLEGYNHTYCRREFFDATFPTFLKYLYHPKNRKKVTAPPAL